MMAMRGSIAVAALLGLGLVVSEAQEHRQLGAHVHGHGHLNIAVEGQTVSMELEVPGADITGFEHEPSTAAQKATLEDARAKLREGLNLFAPPPGAGCSLKTAAVTIEAEHGDEHEHEAGHADVAGAPSAGSPSKEEEADHHHSEFHVEYQLECTSLPRLTSMTFNYFNVFAGARELDVALITPNGQTSVEVTRDHPSLDLTGIM